MGLGLGSGLGLGLGLGSRAGRLGQVLEPLGVVRGVEQVVAALVVDLEVRDAHLGVGVAAQLGEDVRERAWDDAAVGVALGAASDRERLAGAGLAVGEDRAVEALEDGVDDPCGGLLVEDLVRAGVRVRVRVRNRVGLAASTCWLGLG